MKKNIKIQGERIYLRELEVEDVSKEYCNWLNDPETNKYLETKRATIRGLKEYVRQKKENKNCLFLGIFLKGSNKHIGNIKFETIDWSKKTTGVGIMIGDKGYINKGIGTETMKIVTEYVFRELGLEKINLGVVSNNKGAIRCYKKIGFEIEEVKLNSVKCGDKLCDGIFMVKEKIMRRK